ncbi:hypothetical protein [Mesorhizobium mediterraneum]|uniref:hypothetical protein n=1 Tax=Mesorhizobium mediterraneum TaxID=43617 RepID=UPI003CC9BE7E
MVAESAEPGANISAVARRQLCSLCQLRSRGEERQLEHSDARKKEAPRSTGRIELGDR